MHININYFANSVHVNRVKEIGKLCAILFSIFLLHQLINLFIDSRKKYVHYFYGVSVIR